MAFFKFRKDGDGSPAAAPQPESVETLRRRARHRLIGAAVLVLLGVVGFPLLFDTQPRPVALDIPIEIPDRNKAKPLPAPVPLAAGSASAAKPETRVAAAPAAPTAAASSVARAPAVSGAVTAAPEAAKAVPAPAPTPAPVAKAPAAAPAEPADGARAQALLEDKPLPASAPKAVDGRFVVQVGAFADPAKARETRLKVEKAGLKTYTHEAETKDGKRIRVRVGPFTNKAEAEKAAGRIKELELPVQILTL